MDVIALVGLLVVLALLLLAIVRWGVHPFLALTVASLVVGPVMGLSATAAVEEYLVGFGVTLKWIGVVLVLGAIIGQLLDASGGVLRIADTVLRAVGRRRLPLAMGLTGYVVSIPAFVDVAYIMLKPVVEVLAARSGRRVLVVGLSLTAGLTATHALLPPTPGPLATAAILGADLGRVILINAVVAAFALAAGLLWATLYCGRFELDSDRALHERYVEAPPPELERSAARPSAVASFAPILLPLVLIAAGSFVGEQRTSPWALALRYAGTPVVALLLGMIVATLSLPWGGRLGRLRELTDRAIERCAVVMMITGAGGGLGAVIKASGVGDQIAGVFEGLALPGLLLPFLLAMALTTATGSLTVAMVTSSAVVAPLLPTLGLSAEMAVALIGAGSLSIIHANSSFFWLLSRLHGVRPDVLYCTYSLQSLCMGLGGLLGVMLLRLLGVS